MINKQVTGVKDQADNMFVEAYRGIEYRSKNNGPIPLTDTVVTGIGKYVKEYNDAELQDIIPDARDNGIIHNGEVQQSRIMKENRDVLRIKLETDLESKLPPLKLKRKEGALPHLPTLRRYLPMDRKFIFDTIRPCSIPIN